MEWKDVKKALPPQHGWYAAAVNPVNHDPEHPEESNFWRESFGFAYVWYNPSTGWFEQGNTGRGCVEITDRVTHWAILPKVPLY